VLTLAPFHAYADPKDGVGKRETSSNKAQSMDGFSLGLILAGVLAAVQLVLLALQAFEHYRYAARRLQKKAYGHPTGQALVIIPCRGLEHNLEQNLAGFFSQDYTNYSLRFVVQSQDDPALGVIERLISEHPHVPAELVVAGPATNEAQKVHNLRAATHAIPESIRYLVFADSDASPSPSWLRALVSRLEESRSAAVTGYRWFVPTQGTFREAVVSSLNAAYAMLMAGKTPNLVWGGTWATTRESFQKLGIRDAWEGQICDDLVVARLLLRRGLRVQYEPACLVATACYSSIREMIAFIHRQYFLLRHVLPAWWLFDTLVGNYHILVFWTAISATVLGGNSVRWTGLATASVLFILNWVRAEFRAAAASAYFPQLAHQPPFQRIFWWDRVANSLIATLGFVLSISAGLRRSVSWRGITYRIERNGLVQVWHGTPAHDTSSCPGERGSESAGQNAAVLFSTDDAGSDPHRSAA
jgi:cellulose synthase/poly-beta-1,6-N-acetylglucosamine synthase-like glycosyltransferase